MARKKTKTISCNTAVNSNSVKEHTKTNNKVESKPETVISDSSLQANLAHITNKVSVYEDGPLKDIAQLLIASLKLNHELELKLQDNKKEIKHLEAKSNSLEKRMCRLECEKVKNSIIIKDVPLHKSTEKDKSESAVQTRETVDHIFKKLEVNVEGCYEAIRFSKSKTNSETAEKDPIVQVRFWTEEGKHLFFQELGKRKAKSKDSIIQKIKLSDEIPNCLKSEFSSLSKKAFELRKGETGTKTRINFDWNRGSIRLLVKKAGEEEFSELKSN